MSMTNEELAVLIQQGRNKLIPVLWEKVRKLLYMKSEQFYQLHKEACSRRGVELWDIKQISYYAFLDAVKAYKPDSGYKFTSFLDYPFRNRVSELTGLRGAGRNEPLNNCTSLNKPVDEEDGDCTLIDLQADETSTDFIDEIDRSSEAETVRAAVAQLDERYRQVIELHFFKGMTLKEIGELIGVSTENIRQRKEKALRQLRGNKELRKMYAETKAHIAWTGVSRFRYQPEYYALVKQLEARNISYGYTQAEILAAEIRWWEQYAEEHGY